MLTTPCPWSGVSIAGTSSLKRETPHFFFIYFFWQVISSDRTLAPKNQMHKSKEIQLLSFPTLPDEDAQEKQKLA